MTGMQLVELVNQMIGPAIALFISGVVMAVMVLTEGKKRKEESEWDGF